LAGFVTYPPRVAGILKRHGVTVGDEVRVTLGGRSYQGIVMPHHALSGEDVLTLKLPTGYNVGLTVQDGMLLELVAKASTVVRKPPPAEAPEDKPVVSFLSTGGTIASYVDYRTGAVHPALTAEDLVFSVPELPTVARVRARVAYSILSEDMKPEYWQRLAREVASEFSGGAAGVVIPHGTDTLGVTAAALSFMVRDLPGPVALVGAQRSPDRPSSDASMNLLAATRLASTDLGEVVAVLHANTGDDYCAVHRGTKVRKMHSSRRDAFRSINRQPLGRIYPDGRVEWVGDHRRRSGALALDIDLEPDVALVHFYPGMKPQILEAVVAHSKGVVIAGSGLGHISTDLVPVVRSAVEAGVHVVVATQTLYGRVGLLVYSRGRELLQAGVIPAEDMLPETAMVKLMWVLGHTKDPGEVRRLMLQDIVGEFNPAIGLQDFGE
jgi:glutamyl-tRNA(Gln) amidotransferase subunit D